MNITQYLRALRQRWQFVVGAAVLGIVIALLMAPGAVDRSTFNASATLLQSSQIEEPAASTAVLATSDAVAARVATVTNYPGPPGDLLARVTAEGDKNSNSVKIIATGSSPDDAIALTNAFANATVQEFLARQSVAAGQQLIGLRAQLDEVNRLIDQGGGDAASDRATQARTSALSSQYTEIFGRIQAAENQQRTPTGLEAVTPASQAAVDGGTLTLSSLPVLLAVGFLLGSLLGAAVALVLAHFDNRPRDREAARAAYRLPVLAEIPEIPSSSRNGFSVVTASEPSSAAAEAFRSLRSSLMLASGRMPRHRTEEFAGPARPRLPQVIMVGSARASEGKTVTLVNLAACLADAGLRVLVLDCDFRGPDTYAYFGVPPQRGLSNLVTEDGAPDLAGIVVPTDIAGVQIATAGTALKQPSTLPPRMGEFIEQARRMADVVLIDSAPMLLANDATDLMPHVDTVLVVAFAGRTTSEQAARAAELLTRGQVPVIGLALVGVRGQSQRDLMSFSSVPGGGDPNSTMKLPTVSTNGAKPQQGLSVASRKEAE